MIPGVRLKRAGKLHGLAACKITNPLGLRGYWGMGFKASVLADGSDPAVQVASVISAARWPFDQ